MYEKYMENMKMQWGMDAFKDVKLLGPNGVSVKVYFYAADKKQIISKICSTILGSNSQILTLVFKFVALEMIIFVQKHLFGSPKC